MSHDTANIGRGSLLGTTGLNLMAECGVSRSAGIARLPAGQKPSRFPDYAVSANRHEHRRLTRQGAAEISSASPLVNAAQSALRGTDQWRATGGAPARSGCRDTFGCEDSCWRWGGTQIIHASGRQAARRRAEKRGWGWSCGGLHDAFTRRWTAANRPPITPSLRSAG